MHTIGKFRQSSSFIVGLFFSTLLMVGVFFVLYFVVMAGENALLKESKDAINSEITLLQKTFEHVGFEALEDSIREKTKDPENAYFYALKPEVSSLLIGNVPNWPEVFSEPQKGEFVFFDIAHELLDSNTKSIRIGSEHYDIMAIIRTLPNGSELLVGRNIDDIEIALWVAGTFGWLMILILFLVSALSIALGYYVVIRFNRIAESTDRIIASGNLSERLPVESSWDDLSKLSIVLNKMLDELEEMLNSIKSVSDNIAHDLRTPLARLRQDIEAFAQPEKRELLLGEVDNILSIFSGLLRIADIESEKQKSAFEVRDIGVIANDVVEMYTPVAEEKSIQVDSNIAEAQVYSDRDLLFQCFGNLIHNAIKFTPHKGKITVSLTQDGNKTVFSICDTGIGVSDENKERVTSRFFRVDKSRASSGNGLGLAMVAAVVKLHEAELVLSDNEMSDSGLCCQITFLQ
ncbi:two-component sensor histidine kinase [Tenacibaculum sp. KUL113]|uniref:sensor histidine kinase n=1 Tax=Alteromonas sp. KUL150 TaxID=2480805 RepID=UPI0012E493B0|nr:HAMP domain-containing sensor histidine kinase [Alteromonas sp. KUL150]GFD72387.1 two-component sensor histidine kinase [Tenacibaculum sp. KUL113]GFD85814.1 two-component sensor histidine kinase [Alteromonas sp. KUL150]